MSDFSNAFGTFKNDTTLINQWRNGDENYDMPTENGPVPSPKKLIRSLQDAINAQAPSLAQLANTSGGGGAALVGYRGRTVADRLNETFFSVKDYGAIGDGNTDDTLAVLATFQAAKDSGGGTVYFPPGRYKISQPIDLGDYCVTDSISLGAHPNIKVNINILGAGEHSTTLLWAGGGSGTGSHGICLLLRSRTLGGNENYYFGSASGFSIDSNLPTADFTGHAGGFAITNRFTTIAAGTAGCDPTTDYATYPKAIDTANPNSTSSASCGVYARTISPASVDHIQVRGMCYGFWFGVGYATQATSLRATWCIVGIAFRDAVTTTTPRDSIFEKCAIGAMFSTTSHVGLKDCAVQGNYAGCDVYFHTWNRRCYLKDVYFEASPRNVVIRTDSSGQYRNSEHVISGCTGLKLDVDLGAISVLYVERNHIKSSVFNTSGTGSVSAGQFYAVYVKDNYYYDETSERRKTLFTNWGIPDRYLRVQDSEPLTNNEPLSLELSAGKVAELTKTLTAASSANAQDFVLTLPNTACAGVVELTGVLARSGNTVKDVLYWSTRVGFTRQAGAVALAAVDTINSTLLTSQPTGISAGTPAIVTATVSGGETETNTVTIGASKGATGGNTAVQTVTARLIVAQGSIKFDKA